MEAKKIRSKDYGTYTLAAYWLGGRVYVVEESPGQVKTCRGLKGGQPPEGGQYSSRRSDEGIRHVAKGYSREYALKLWRELTRND